jgi:hypothetical protein
LAGAVKEQERFFSGKAPGVVTIREGGSSRVLAPLPGLERRAFTWGHDEAGAEHLALALLKDALGDDEMARRFHQRFRRRVIANFPKRWTITRTRIVAHVNMMKSQNNRCDACVAAIYGIGPPTSGSPPRPNRKSDKSVRLLEQLVEVTEELEFSTIYLHYSIRNGK